MSFLRTLLMFVFVFSLGGISGSYAGKETSSILVFDKCIGHKTICDDNFNEKIFIKKKLDGTIATQLIFQHPDILEVSEGRIDINDKSFTSIHIIKNNLNKKFLMKLEGNIYNLSKMKLIVLYNNEKLATISLKNIH
tara:strand:+ start:37 stop:447 length:411 start_codon:yes stop_codon:yes gene_type:complete